MKKLLVIGSDSIHVYNFIELLKDYFDDVLLLTDKKHREYNVQTIGIDFFLSWSSISAIKEIKSIVKEFQPTTVHLHQANSYSFLTLLTLRKFSCQKILTAWGSDILINPKESLLLRGMVKYILNHVDYVTADSDIVLSEAQNLVEKKLKTHNINFGIEVASCDIPKEDIIYSNRLHKSLYNIDKIIISFSKFVTTNPTWRVVLAGDGDETEELKTLVEELNLTSKVEFIGWVDSVTNNQYYCKSKIYVSIPKSDSVSLSLVEGVVCGCIPFVSNLEANRELIDDRVGFIVDDLENISFERYSEIESEKFEKRREEIEYLFSKSFNKERYLKLYEI